LEIAKVYILVKYKARVPLVLDKSGGYNGAQVCNNENNNINEEIK